MLSWFKRPRSQALRRSIIISTRYIFWRRYSGFDGRYRARKVLASRKRDSHYSEPRKWNVSHTGNWQSKHVRSFIVCKDLLDRSDHNDEKWDGAGDMIIYMRDKMARFYRINHEGDICYCLPSHFPNLNLILIYWIFIWSLHFYISERSDVKSLDLC